MISLFIFLVKIKIIFSLCHRLILNLLKWLGENRLFVNANKSNVIVFGTPQRAINRICNIAINNSVSQQVDNIKLLGIGSILMLTYVGSTILTLY